MSRSTRRWSRLSTAPATAADERTRRYFYRSLPHHLAEAGEREKLDALLLDPGWLKAKLAATGNPQALVADYEQYGVGEAQNFIGRTLRLTTGICARDPRQLLPQLFGRLTAFEAAPLPTFLERLAPLVSRPRSFPFGLSLDPARRRDRPPRGALGLGSTPVPAAGRAARLGLLRTTRSGCGT